MTKTEIKKLMVKYAFWPKKKLGQNFLVDEEIQKKILEFLNLSEDDIVIEIGPGLGALTGDLSGKAGKVIAVEVDKNLCRILKETLSTYKNLEIVCADILKFDIQQYLHDRNNDISISDSNHSILHKVKVVGNLPYYITSPILIHLLKKKFSIIETILVTVQEEVARRLVAKPTNHDRGAISCFVQFYSKPSLLIPIGKQSFFPRPKVDSRLLKLDVLTEPSVLVQNEELFFEIVRSSFSHRRKILINSLASGKLNLSKDFLLKILKESGIDPGRRGETLDLEEFAKVANLVNFYLMKV